MNKSNFKTILFSGLSGARVNVVGQLFGSEIIGLIFLPFVKLKFIFTKTPFKNLIFPYFLFLISLIFSDIFVNNTSPDQFLRGWANILFSFLQVIFITSLFLDEKKNYVYYFFFSAISFFIFRPVMEGEFLLQSNDFKVYFMSGVNYLVYAFIFLLRKKNRYFSFALLLFYSFFCILADARSNAFIFFLGAILYLFKILKIKFSLSKSIVVGIFLLSLSYLAYFAYADMIISGSIGGANAQQILKLENPYNPLELLIEGRRESFFPIYPILDQPIFGYGSWANDNTGKYIDLYSKMIESPTQLDSQLIPAHSIYFAAWLWAGIGGMVGVFLLYLRVFKMAVELYRKTNNTILIIVSILLLDQAWNFLFSPLGHIRQTSPLFFAMVIVEYYTYQNNINKIRLGKVTRNFK